MSKWFSRNPRKPAPPIKIGQPVVSSRGSSRRRGHTLRVSNTNSGIIGTYTISRGGTLTIDQPIDFSFSGLEEGTFRGRIVFDIEVVESSYIV